MILHLHLVLPLGLFELIFTVTCKNKQLQKDVLLRSTIINIGWENVIFKTSFIEIESLKLLN